jgi:hypothetical protein
MQAALCTGQSRYSLETRALFGWADKPVEKHSWLICYERKMLFWLKKQAEKDGL